LFGKAFTTERGRIKLFGRMDWTLFPSQALALNLQSIGKELGEDFVYGRYAEPEKIFCIGKGIKPS
jgi:hypothetical protein